MKLTQHDQLVLGLEALGASKLPKKNKYTMLKLGVHYYFVGKAGALRLSSRPSVATSNPCNKRFRKHVLDAQFVTEGL